MNATYPSVPGYKTNHPDTSKAAAKAERGRAETLRSLVYSLLTEEDLTADECAERLRESVLAVRPRLSELRADGKIDPTGARRCNASGHRAAVWMTVRRFSQQEMFA